MVIPDDGFELPAESGLAKLAATSRRALCAALADNVAQPLTGDDLLRVIAAVDSDDA